MSYNKNYYKKNKNRLLDKQKRRNVRRRNSIKAYMEKYYIDNRSELLRRQKSYYSRRTGYYRDYMKNYHKKRTEWFNY